MLLSGRQAGAKYRVPPQGANAIILLGYIETDIGHLTMGDGTERIERRLKLHDLRVLMSVVERGSMAKAADSLASSQPAISRAITDLEYSLGVRLLDQRPARRRTNAVWPRAHQTQHRYLR